MSAIEITGATLVAFIVASVAVSVVLLADVVRCRIPNPLWILLILSGQLFHTLTPLGHGLVFSLVGAFLGFGLLFMPFLAGGIAARDLKLTACVGAWLGPPLTICVFACIAVVAALYFALSYFECNDLEASLARFRVMYHRLSSLLHYLATDDGAAETPQHADLDERLISYTTAIFLSTLLVLSFLVLVV